MNATEDRSFSLDDRVAAAAWPLAVVDAVSLVLVFTLGTVRHNGVSYPIDRPIGWLVTLSPFLVGWLLVGPLVGAYSAGAAESAKAALPLAVRAWVPAGVLAIAIRAVALDGGFPPVFVAVTLVSGAVGLVIGRWVRFRL